MKRLNIFAGSQRKIKMFKISPIQSKDEQLECSIACGAQYIEGYFAYSMRDSETGALMGFSQFEIGSEYGYINDLKPVLGLDDYEAMFILGRATMNFIDTCGTHKVRAPISAADEKLMRDIGFKKVDESEYFCDMTGFFDGKCHK